MFDKSESEDDSSDESDAIDAAIRQATGGKKGNKRGNNDSELDYNNHQDEMFSDDESAKGKFEEKLNKKINQKNAW